MPARSKLNLERFKKSTQGLIEFAKLIEQAAPAMRKSIIQRTQKEDPDFLEKALKRVVYFDELIYLDVTVLAEILSVVPPKILAYALMGTSKDFSKKFLEQVGFRNLRQVQDEQERIGPRGSSALILGAQNHILKSARSLENKNKFVFELTDCPRLKKKPAA